MKDLIWIDTIDAKAIHARQLAEHGGLEGVRDQGMLESAMSRPRQKLSYSDPAPGVPELAASYAFGIARNHPFVDGNKRNAAVVCEAFMNLNGFDLTASDEEAYLMFYGLAAGEISEQQLIDWVKKCARESQI